MIGLLNKAIVDLPIRMKGNSKHTTGNSLKSVTGPEQDIRDLKIQRRDCKENVAKKVNLLSFSLYRNYSYPLTLSNVLEPSWS